MDQTSGILVLVKRDPNGGNLDVFFGLRSHNDIPETSYAVGDREHLESIGIEIVADSAVINGKDVFKEWIVSGPLGQHVQELGNDGSDFKVVPISERSAAWAALDGDIGKGLRHVWQCLSDTDLFFLLYDSANYQGGIEADIGTFGSSLYALVAINSGLYWKTPPSTN